jgi:hypothetical protein
LKSYRHTLALMFLDNQNLINYGHSKMRIQANLTAVQNMIAKLMSRKLDFCFRNFTSTLRVLQMVSFPAEIFLCAENQVAACHSVSGNVHALRVHLTESKTSAWSKMQDTRTCQHYKHYSYSCWCQISFFFMNLSSLLVHVCNLGVVFNKEVSRVCDNYKMKILY